MPRSSPARRGGWHLVWLSHVFFDSAFVVRDLAAICDAAPREAMIVIDGYHAFCALPVDRFPTTSGGVRRLLPITSLLPVSTLVIVTL